LVMSPPPTPATTLSLPAALPILARNPPRSALLLRQIRDAPSDRSRLRSLPRAPHASIRVAARSPHHCRSPTRAASGRAAAAPARSEEHTSELQSRENLVCRLLLE